MRLKRQNRVIYVLLPVWLVGGSGDDVETFIKHVILLVHRSIDSAAATSILLPFRLSLSPFLSSSSCFCI